jgi:glycosyltransferase involved in cell wall biosynthesis
LIESVPPSIPVHRIKGDLPNFGGGVRDRLERWFRLPSLFSDWWIRSATKLGNQVANGEALIFATMSPFESGQVARRLSEQLRIPWVADLRDPWALDEMQVYPTAFHRRAEMWKMERLLSTAALIIMNTPEATSALKVAFPSLRDKTVLTIPNGFDHADYSEAIMPRHDGKFRIIHSGYLHTDNGVELRKRKIYRLLGGAQSGVDILTRSHTVLLDAVERWRAQRPEIDNDLEIVFAGKTSEQDRAVVNESPVRSLVRFTGYVPHQNSVELVRTADLLFLPMHNLPLGRRSRIVPGKTYEYMASGRPILAAAPDGDARDFLHQCGTAMICRPDDAVEMVRILDEVYRAWKNKQATRHCNKPFVDQFERRNLTRNLAVAFRSMLPSY